MSRASVAPKIAVLGTCQVAGLGAVLQAILPGSEINCWHLGVYPVEPEQSTFERLRNFDVIVTQMRDVDSQILELTRLQATLHNVVFIPTVVFRGFQPDGIYLSRPGGIIEGGLSGLHSIIISCAYCLGLSVQRVPRLFNAYTYRALGYFEVFDAARATLLQTFQDAGYDLALHIERWLKLDGPFMHTIIHPHICVLRTLALHAGVRAGLITADTPEPEGVRDALADVQWPIYPELARRFGVPGTTTFTQRRATAQLGEQREVSLPEFVQQCYARYAELTTEEIAAGLPEGTLSQFRQLLS